jgi:hypothetical protein
MKNLKDRLTILHTTNNVTFSDLSNPAFDFLRDPIGVSKTLYIGYRKPINAIYFHVSDPAEYNGTWTWSYYNGTSWGSLDEYDSTLDFEREGFVQWERPEDEDQTTVNGKRLYWYRVEHDLSSETVIDGIGALFCSAEDLKKEYSYLDDVADPAKYIYSLVAARDKMLDELNVSAWDIFNHSDTRKAATYLALSIIFQTQSDRPDDRWAVLADSYLGEYRTSKSALLLQIDLNDNGKIDDGETIKPRAWRWGQ